MTDAPERIWARPVGTVRDWNHTCGHWSLDKPYGSSVKYIRADIAEVEKRAAVAAAVKRMLDHAWDMGAPEMLYAEIEAEARAVSDTDALAEYVERVRAEERERICGLICALKDEPEIEGGDGDALAFNAGWDSACSEAMISINAEAAE